MDKKKVILENQSLENELNKNEEQIISENENAQYGVNEDEKDSISNTLKIANERLICSEAVIQAVSLGLSVEKAKLIVKLADLSKVQIGADGEFDSENIKGIMCEVLEKVPELKRNVNLNGIGVNPENVDFLTKEDEFASKIEESRGKGDLQAVVRLKRQAASHGLIFK